MSDSRPEKCSHCKNPCTIHLTQIVDGSCAKVDLCQDCPVAKNAQSNESFNLIGDFGGPKTIAPSFDKKTGCPACGFTKENFKERGRLGCSYCYTFFESSIEPILENIHTGTEHLGKCPGKESGRPKQMDLGELKKKLSELILREEYEQAAVVRDQIKELEP